MVCGGGGLWVAGGGFGWQVMEGRWREVGGGWWVVGGGWWWMVVVATEGDCKLGSTRLIIVFWKNVIFALLIIFLNF